MQVIEDTTQLVFYLNDFDKAIRFANETLGKYNLYIELISVLTNSDEQFIRFTDLKSKNSKIFVVKLGDYLIFSLRNKELNIYEPPDDKF